MPRATLADHAALRGGGYLVRRSLGYGDAPCQPPAWELVELADPDGGTLMVGSHGCQSPTEWEAVAEGLERIRVG